MDFVVTDDQDDTVYDTVSAENPAQLVQKLEAMYNENYKIFNKPVDINRFTMLFDGTSTTCVMHRNTRITVAGAL